MIETIWYISVSSQYRPKKGTTSWVGLLMLTRTFHRNRRKLKFVSITNMREVSDLQSSGKVIIPQPLLLKFWSQRRRPVDLVLFKIFATRNRFFKALSGVFIKFYFFYICKPFCIILCAPEYTTAFYVEKFQ